MSSVKEKIIDYELNKETIDYWFSIKCEQKYDQFIKMLQNKDIDITWENVSGLYRYDKRLIFNTFNYISFLEEYLRAIVVRASVDKDETYVALQKKTLSGLISDLKKMDDGIVLECVQSKNPFDELNRVRELRNCIAHNNIIIQQNDYIEAFESFYKVLPSAYRDGFKKDIIGCMDKIEVSNNWPIFDSQP